VCLLDEATSALDVRTERALAEAMAELMKGARRGVPVKG
jgi:ABC-type multidrug transport system fused ATPase/permease subunit